MAAASAFAGIGKAASNLGGTLYGASQSRKAAKKQRKFIERMSNTAHQREARDLEAAGLNRILTATGGPGASTGSPGIAQVPDFSRVGDAALEGVSTATNIKKEKKETDRITSAEENLKEDTKLKGAQRETTVATGIRETANSELLGQQARTSAEQMKQFEIQNNILEMQKAGWENKQAFDRTGRARDLYEMQQWAETLGRIFGNTQMPGRPNKGPHIIPRRNR